ncbi:Receptor-like protein 12 [Rhynchospora pubera]|uniref:Receptor-like protein 12 n=1 Tax=Rhynchospora pubera TaxID=906938 RepID=A0AAV8DTS4_9POAL|nr:Receptor-like protein 12 [Rhynchospora pubera]
MVVLHLSLPLTLLLLFSLSSEFTSLAQVQCLPDQRDALVQLKHGFTTSKLQSWNSTIDCCTWEGVTCDPVTGRVTALELSNRAISGRIDPTLFNLSSLENLSLADNLFYEVTLPDTGFERLSNLTHLNLSNSGFVGQIPFGISQLTNLVLLDLSTFYLNVQSNSLYVSKPSMKALLANLTKLQFLYLDGVNISLNGSEWGPAVSQLGRTLQQLSLAGPVPGSFFKLSQLSVLNLASNNFTGKLDLGSLRNLKNLNSLDVSNNMLSFTDGTSGNKSCYLQVLDLSYNYFTGELPHCLLGTTLAVLNLKNNKLSGALPQVMSEDCRFQTINLNGNNINGTLPQFLMNCSSLEVLDIGNNELYDMFPYWLGDLKKLRVLVLRSNKLYGPVSMPRSHLGSNDSAFPMLQIFDISSNYFNGTLPKECFKNLNSMMNNSKASTSLTIGFKYLDLGENYYQNSVTVTFKGSEVTFVSTLAMFNSLDFSGNNFEGEIPQEIGELKMLLLLNMSHNALTGTIPTKIGDLQQLESLDLSSNELTGNIPEELTLLTFLSSLNLSHNNLVGKIPQLRQFLTFTNNSYFYNPGLCGEPLTVQCETTLAVFPASVTEFSVHGTWLFIFAELGFVVGLAVVFVPLMVWNEWREQFNKHVDRFLQPVLPF